MAPDPPSDPIVFSSLHVLVQQQPHPHPNPQKTASTRCPSGMSRLSSFLAAPSPGSKRSYKRRSRKSGLSRRRGGRSNENIKPSLQYVKPGALAQIRDVQRTDFRSSFSSSSFLRCMNVSRLVPPAEDHTPLLSEHEAPATVATPGPSVRVFGPVCPQRKKLLAPKTSSSSRFFIVRPGASSSLFSMSDMPMSADTSHRGDDITLDRLPLELLVRIVCNLHHDQLKPAFHVCKSLRQAVLIARECYFDFTTPDRDRQAVLRLLTPKAELNWQVVRSDNDAEPSFPRAPKHASKLSRARIPLGNLQQLAQPGLEESNDIRSSNNMRLCRARPPFLHRPVFRAATSHRVLLYEEELCQAVAQNSI